MSDRSFQIFRGQPSPPLSVYSCPLLTHCYSNIEMPGSWLESHCTTSAITCIRGVECLPTENRRYPATGISHNAPFPPRCARASQSVTRAREIYANDNSSTIFVCFVVIVLFLFFPFAFPLSFVLDRSSSSRGQFSFFFDFRFDDFW